MRTLISPLNPMSHGEGGPQEQELSKSLNTHDEVFISS